jgi:hypothetical protein
VQTVVGSAIKVDKREWMRRKQVARNLQKHLLLIHCHGTDFPNAGSLVTALDGFYRRLVRLGTVQNPMQLISIAVDIGYNSPRCFPACAAIVSKLLSTLPTDAEKISVVDRIRKRLGQLPNNGHLEVWLQRISYYFNPVLEYGERLCGLVDGTEVDLWSNSWIADADLKAAADASSIVNRKRLKALSPIVLRGEFGLFEAY